MIERCETCRWWRVRPAQYVGNCEMAETMNAKPLHAETKAEAHDGDGNFGLFITRPDFGCIQWELGGYKEMKKS
jgi:hypothetical protein